ncbi:Rpp14 family [Purpureocillium lavendulum]|uniref:Ribonuclease P/MRP protein subunit POP5 n=1 Tax=Purpureocillium lavendulum TaxID=1247861 RepID=A0AB34FZU1_9HYPO|nr:Rpp14 family [Purpureocillium lavendulum]
MVRIKERYLLVNIVYPPEAASKTASRVPDLVVHRQPTVERLTPQALLRAIRTEAALLFGDYGAGALEGHLTVKYLSLATSTFILRCSRAHYQMLWASLTFMDRVPVKDGRPCIFRVVRVSGTMRKAEEEAIRQARALILAAKDEGSSAKATIIGSERAVSDQVMSEYRSELSDDAMDQDDG